MEKYRNTENTEIQKIQKYRKTAGASGTNIRPPASDLDADREIGKSTVEIQILWKNTEIQCRNIEKTVEKYRNTV